jgi:hypothetical protein
MDESNSSIALKTVHFSDYIRSMIRTLTVSEAKPCLGALLDQVSLGKELLLRRKHRLYRVEEVAAIAPIPRRPPGFFQFDDELSRLADRAEPSLGLTHDD